MPNKQEVWYLTLLFGVTLVFGVAVALVLTLLMTTTDPKVNGEMRVEVLKYLLQFTVIIIVGGAVAALFRYAERRRDEKKIRSEIRTDYLQRLGALYRHVKASRRTLRAEGLTTKYASAPKTISGKQAEIYKKQMIELNDAQLELEGLKIEANSVPAFVSLPELSGTLKQMEDYLRQILTEYENHRPLIDSNHTVHFADLERLDEFTGATKRSFQFSKYTKKTDYRLKSHFSDRYESVIKMISQRLV